MPLRRPPNALSTSLPNTTQEICQNINREKGFDYGIYDCLKKWYRLRHTTQDNEEVITYFVNDHHHHRHPKIARVTWYSFESSPLAS